MHSFLYAKKVHNSLKIAYLPIKKNLIYKYLVL